MNYTQIMKLAEIFLSASKKIPVDTGGIIICDPCHLKDASDWWDRHIDSGEPLKPLKNENGVEIAFHISFGGDGSYSLVEKKDDNGITTGVVIGDA